LVPGALRLCSSVGGQSVSFTNKLIGFVRGRRVIVSRLSENGICQIVGSMRLTRIEAQSAYRYYLDHKTRFSKFLFPSLPGSVKTVVEAAKLIAGIVGAVLFVSFGLVLIQEMAPRSVGGSSAIWLLAGIGMLIIRFWACFAESQVYYYLS